MSKRHQSSRRRSYGRRQHELHERGSHQRTDHGIEQLDQDAYGDPGSAETVAFLGSRAARPRYAIGE